MTAEPPLVSVGAADIGGTHVTVATVDPSTAAFLDRPRRLDLPAQAERGPLLDALASALTGVAKPPDRWSLAWPGPFDYERGICRITGLAKLDALYGVDLRAELGERLGTSGGQRIVFLNDAHAFGLGEWWAGNAQAHRRVIAVTLGTGLGSAFLDDGERVTQGSRVPRDGWIYHLPVQGAVADELISSRGILRRYGSNEDLTVRALAERAHAGDTRAVQTFAEVATLLGELLAPWIERFEATCLVVGGSIAGAWDLLRPHLRGAASGTQVMRARRLQHASLLGAALYARRAEHPPSPPRHRAQRPHGRPAPQRPADR